jgi:regulatory protein
MFVTKIERQQRHPRKVNVFIDHEFAFAIHDDVLVGCGLNKGDAVDKRIIDEIIMREEFALAKETALRLIRYRFRSEQELRLKLLEKEFDPDIVAETIKSFRELGVVDDAKFARAFVHNKLLRKPAGKKLLQQQLRRKGILPSTIDHVLHENINDEEEQRMAHELTLKLIQRYKRSRKIVDHRKRQQQIVQYLIRRGFGWNTISPVIKKIFHNQQTME